MPHGGTDLPAAIAARLNANGRRLADTDWHIDQLYAGLRADATTVQAGFHRYVIDANRDPSGASLYPGQNTTALVPLTDFDGLAIWDQPPDAAEVAERCATFHFAYHAALRAELDRVKARHGVAVLYDCHSIRSRIPFLFDGVLPDLNIGTDGGVTCAPVIATGVLNRAMASPYKTVINGRFKGGWTTRHYGQPEDGVHAIQMEIAQAAYLTAEAAPWTYDDRKAARLRPWLKDMLDTICDTALEDLPR
jgi:formiminoglutamase